MCSDNVVKKPLHTLQSFLNLARSDRIRNPDPRRVPKRISRHDSYVGFAQHEFAELPYVVDNLAAKTLSKLLSHIEEEIKVLR